MAKAISGGWRSDEQHMLIIIKKASCLFDDMVVEEDPGLKNEQIPAPRHAPRAPNELNARARASFFTRRGFLSL